VTSYKAGLSLDTTQGQGFPLHHGLSGSENHGHSYPERSGGIPSPEKQLPRLQANQKSPLRRREIVWSSFLYNKTKQTHQFHKFILPWNSTCFGPFVCPSSGVYSLYTQQWYTSYSCWAGPGWNCICNSTLVLLESCLQSCMTYIIVKCTVNKLLMMGRGTARNM
jgi:hypothetical protein